MSKFIDFYKTSSPSANKVAPEKATKYYKKLRFQAFIAATFGYSLYYVCRTSLNVVKGPIIESGMLNATQLGTIGLCLFWAYAVGKFINGFLADHSNITRFMATGLVVSTFANLILGLTDAFTVSAAVTNATIFTVFAIMWGLNGWAQSMGAPPAIISLSRWYPLKIRGTYYGFFSASHNFGEFLSFLFVGLLVSAFGWQWGFFGAAVAGALGVILILFWLHDTPESKGLAPIEVLSGEMTQEELDAQTLAKKEDTEAIEASKKETSRIQRAVLRNPGVWILALASAFMYMSRYAINSWGILFLEKIKGFSTVEASTIISINAICGVVGTVLSGWMSDTLFHGDRKYPALVAGILEAVSLYLFLFGGNSWFINILAMLLFGIAIGVLICFLGGLMAIDIVPRKATGAALGVVGMASYAAAGIQDVISGVLIDNMATRDAAGEIIQYDFTYVSWFWIAAAVISFLLPILNWRRKQANI
ncbi:MAG: MFS transporter [Bacteroidaceae bacterium]|jgi:OPA family sugar phosphate sensor protein UhpC-like MFS transporter|nr:MFS transporter [Bacteroidaceae bacterium]